MKRMTSGNICMLNWVTLSRFLFCVVVPWTQFVRAEVKVSQVEIETKLSEPFGVDFDQSGAMYVIEYGGRWFIWVGKSPAGGVAGGGGEGVWRGGGGGGRGGGCV